MSAKVRPLLYNLTLTLLAVGITLAMLEMVLRYTHLFGARVAWTVPDPVVGYAFQPGASYWSRLEADHPITGHINQYGWRDREWSLAKPAGETRVAVLGDSFVEAMQVEQDSTFLTLAGAELSQALGHRVELMNFGRSGYTQSEEYLVAERDVLQFNPDVVALFFFPGNDIADINRQTAAHGQRPFFSMSREGRLALDTSFASTRTYRIRAGLAGLKRHSVLVSFLTELYVGAALKLDQPVSTGLDGYLTLCTAHPDSIYARNYALNRRMMEEMHRLLAPRGTALIIVVLPLPAYMPIENRRYMELDSTFDHLWYDKDLSKFAIANGMAFLGLERPFAEAYTRSGAPLNWSDRGHWTYAAHHVVARALSESLLPLIQQAERGPGAHP